MIKAIIFDFDGVVHDTFSFHLDKINQVLSEGTFTADEYKEVHMGNAHEREHLDEILIKKLQHIDWKKYEIFIYDEFINLVAEPEIKEALLLLSQTYNIKESHKVGVKVIAVDCGYHEREILEKGNPTAIVTHLPAVVDVIKDM